MKTFCSGLFSCGRILWIRPGCVFQWLISFYCQVSFHTFHLLKDPGPFFCVSNSLDFGLCVGKEGRKKEAGSTLPSFHGTLGSALASLCPRYGWCAVFCSFTFWKQRSPVDSLIIIYSTLLSKTELLGVLSITALNIKPISSCAE